MAAALAGIAIGAELLDFGLSLAQAGINIKEYNRQIRSLQEQAQNVESDILRNATIESAAMSARTSLATGNMQAFAANIGLDEQSSTIRQGAVSGEGQRQLGIIRGDAKISLMDLEFDLEQRVEALEAKKRTAYFDAAGSGADTASDLGRLSSDIKARRSR